MSKQETKTDAGTDGAPVSPGAPGLSSPPLYSVLQVRNGRFVWVPPGEQDAATLAGLIAGCRITQDVFRSVEAAAR